MIYNAEEKLGFRDVEASWADLIIRKYSTGGVINSSQLEQIRGDLGLCFSDQKSGFDAYRLFSLAKEGEDYSLRKLLIIGILLAKGQRKDKLKLLLEVEDQEATKYIKGRDFVSLIRDVVDISLEGIPLLAMKKTKAQEKDLIEYIEACSLKKEQVVDLVVTSLLNQQVNPEESLKASSILKHMKDPLISQYISSKTLREKAFDLYKKMPLIKN